MATREEMQKEIRYQAKLEMCRRDFYYYCKTMKHEFYVEKTKEAEYLKVLCDTLQDFIFNDKEHNILVVNLPPRHGKSFTIQNFCQFYLGHFPKGHIMVGTYNEDLSTTFAKNVRDTIDEGKGENRYDIIYNDIFPGTRLKFGSKAMNTWSLDAPGAFNSFKSTSPGGSATGYGYSLLVLDDTIRSAEEAFNGPHLEKLWTWYTSTMKSRREKGGKTIVIATRWTEGDISGRLLAKEDPENKIRTLSMSAVLNYETHEMLCDEILDWEKFLDDTDDVDERIVSANYNQVCIDNKNRLYQNLKTYDFNDYCMKYATPWDKDNKNKITFADGMQRKKKLEVFSYCDSADEGDDYLCNIIFAWDYATRMAYVLDVYYTQDAMETTEIEMAKRIDEFCMGTITSRIESNNGGRGFARNVKRILEEEHKNYRANITWFYNSSNKLSRIRANSSQVCKFVYFPEDWRLRWPEFYRDINRFEANGSALHDDSADALTGIIETIIEIGGL